MLKSLNLVNCFICKNKVEWDDEMFDAKYKNEKLYICLNCSCDDFLVDCDKCCKLLPDEEKYYLLIKLKKSKRCVQCYGNKELEIGFLNLRYNYDYKESLDNKEIELLKKDRDMYIDKFLRQQKIIINFAGIEKKYKELFERFQEMEKELSKVKEQNKKYTEINNYKYKDKVNNDNINITNQSSFNDNYLIYLFKHDPETAKNKKIEKFKKNIIKSKLCTVLNHLFLNKDTIKKEKEKKDEELRKKLRINIIKNKTINILRKFNKNHKPVISLIEKIKKNKEIIKFDNKNINESIISSNRANMAFFADLYEEKEIKNALSNKDFMLAVNEFHTDKNSTRMNHLCKIIYLLRKNNFIWNSNIVFKHIYSFQYIKDYQIDYLLSSIEKL